MDLFSGSDAKVGDYEYWILGTNGWEIASALTLLSTVLSLWLIAKHLSNFTRPELQTHIVRILIMVPVYSIDSFLSLLLPTYSLWWDLARDCYEAFCIYSFFVLIVNYVGSSYEEVGSILESKQPFKHPFPFLCLPRVRPGRKLLRLCYQFIIQFVFIKPIVSLAALLCSLLGVYRDGAFKLGSGYFWLTLVDNVSITLALYFLVLYYMAAREELKPFHPVGKFLCIKAVIFFSFWQGVALSILSYFGIVHSLEQWSSEMVSRSLQDFIIGFEMLILAIAHQYVFPYKEYLDYERIPLINESGSIRFLANVRGNVGPVVKNFIAVAKVTDVVEETRNNFFIGRKSTINTTTGPTIIPNKFGQQNIGSTSIQEDSIPCDTIVIFPAE